MPTPEDVVKRFEQTPPQRKRSAWWLLTVLAVGCTVGVLNWTAVAPLSAQPPVETLDDVEPGGSTPATTSPAAGGSANSKSRTALDTLKDAGWIGVIILMLSLVAVYFIIEHSLSIRKSKLMPEATLVELEQMIAQGEIDQAIEYCVQPENYSLASEVILAGLERFKGSDFGFAEYKSAVEEAGEDHTGQLYRRTEVLGVIGAIAPMLGLTGTVLGMISAFSTIAQAGGMAKPDELAGGIGQALVTTLLGLIVAIPAMVAFSFFRNKIDSLVAEAGKRVERVMMPLGRKR